MPEFAAVRIAAEPAPSEMPATGTIEVEFAKGSRVRITGPDDVSLVRAMIAVIAKAGRELPVIGERIFTTHDALPPAGASRKPRRVAPSTRRDAYDARFVDSGSRRFKP